MSYFVVNKQLDYDRGFLCGGQYRDGRLTVSGDGEGCAIFISRLFDSRMPGNEWGRFTLDAPGDAGAGLQVSFYASETPTFQYEGRSRMIQDMISDPKLGADEKEDAFEPLFQKRFVGCRDMLLNGIRGRYLFFILELYPQETGSSCGDMCLYFPKESWLKYLPAVYGMDPEGADFTERFLGIFQSLYDDRQREIRNSEELLNPASCGRTLLEELGTWHGLTDIYLWPDDKLVQLIQRAPYLSAKRGTVGGLREYIMLYTGTEPLIQEDETDPNRVLVSVPEKYLTDTREYGLMLRIIGHMLPAGLSVSVLPLPQPGETIKPASMGVNSILFGTEDASTDRPLSSGMVLEDDKGAEK